MVFRWAPSARLSKRARRVCVVAWFAAAALTMAAVCRLAVAVPIPPLSLEPASGTIITIDATSGTVTMKASNGTSLTAIAAPDTRMMKSGQEVDLTAFGVGDEVALWVYRNGEVLLIDRMADRATLDRATDQESVQLALRSGAEAMIVAVNPARKLLRLRIPDLGEGLVRWTADTRSAYNLQPLPMSLWRPGVPVMVAMNLDRGSNRWNLGEIGDARSYLWLFANRYVGMTGRISKVDVGQKFVDIAPLPLGVGLPLTVRVTERTRYFRDSKPSSLKEMAIGDAVVIVPSSKQKDRVYADTIADLPSAQGMPLPEMAEMLGLSPQRFLVCADLTRSAQHSLDAARHTETPKVRFEKMLVGTLDSIDIDKRYILFESGNRMESMRLTSNAVILRDHKEASLRDLEAGKPVVIVWWQRRDGLLFIKGLGDIESMDALAKRLTLRELRDE